MSPALPAVPASWTPLGTTSNTRYFMANPSVLIVWPNPGLTDDGPSARENLAFQVDAVVKAGRKLGFVVVMSSLVGQNSEARRVYSEGVDGSHAFAVALVVSSPISRAIASFFMGLSKPKVPTRLFETIEAGVQWLDTQTPQQAAP